MEKFVIGKSFLENALVEINFAQLKGADLTETKELIEILIKEHKKYLFQIK